MAKARYHEPKPDDDAAPAAGPHAEQDKWEREQLARTRLGVGVASARAEAAAEEAAKYEMLFEDQIEFVKVGVGGLRGANVAPSVYLFPPNNHPPQKRAPQTPSKSPLPNPQHTHPKHPS